MSATLLPIHAVDRRPFNADAYIKQSTFTDLGQPDVRLRMKDGRELPAHSEILKFSSSVLRNVIRDTLRSTADADDVTASVIPVDDDDAWMWGQSLSVVYRCSRGATGIDDEIWRRILVRWKTSVKSCNTCETSIHCLTSCNTCMERMSSFRHSWTEAHSSIARHIWLFFFNIVVWMSP